LAANVRNEGDIPSAARRRVNSTSDGEDADRARTAGAGRLPIALPLTVFAGAFLLFAIEPMIAKMILPWFGGSAEVWIVCLLFFQAALLAGYLYAHLLSRWLSPSGQRIAHATLLAASLLLLPVVPAPGWRPSGAENPLWLILGLLTATIGVPYVLLAATSPLLQSWFAQQQGTAARSPYRMFALSNFGSFLALLSYPVLIEPFLATGTQARTWSVLYAGFVALCITTAVLTRRRRGLVRRETAAVPNSAIGVADRVIWFLLAACASALLSAITNYLTQNVAAIPLLWVVPLSLYLLSFILCFDSARWYRRPLFLIFFAELAAGMVYGSTGNHANSGLLILLPLYLIGLFVSCMVCHGELAALRPPPRHLTGFYLIVALGGAAGGIFVGALAPAIFSALYELPIALCGTALLAIVVVWRRVPKSPPPSRVPFALALGLWLILAGFAAFAAYRDAGDVLLQARNFYGALKVVRHIQLPEPGETLRLMHGTVDHGEQFVDPARAMTPTTYYSRRSGAGVALRALADSGPLKIGVIGLGAGTLAAYGRAGDVYRFYDIDPLVPPIARTYFTFLGRSPAKIEIEVGDGRLRLEAEPSQGYDALIVDAFSGDAIPVHLLTVEAFALYWRHLKPDGVLAIHISNEYLDLAPVVAKAAALQGKTARLLSNPADTEIDAFASDWMLVADAGFFAGPSLAAQKLQLVPDNGEAWTDDYSNLWRRLK